MFKRNISERNFQTVHMDVDLASDTSLTMVLRKKRSSSTLARYREEIAMDDHQIPLEELAQRYDTDPNNGLDRQKAKERLQKNGPNILVPPPTEPEWLIFLRYMFGGFNALLWAGTALSLTGYAFSYYTQHFNDVDQLYLSAVLIIVIILSGMFGFMQEHASMAIMESFKDMIPKRACVVREGMLMMIPAEQIVVGDLVHVKMGDCVPADMRIVSCNSLKIDNSTVTGESTPQRRTIECSDANPLETRNMAFFGTNVVEGSGTGIVVACGDNSMMGHIAGLTSNLKAGETPLKKEMHHFIKLITLLALGIGTIFFFTSLRVFTFNSAFSFFIAIVVANVPEGLIVTMTASLTMAAKRMKRKHCLVKDLQSVETLGSTNVICSDKTGTLTQNRMTVSHIYYDGNIVDAQLSAKRKNSNRKARSFRSLCLIGILCNSAEFEPDQNNVPVNKRKCTGNPSEISILLMMEKIVGNVMAMREDHVKACEIPFNSTNKYQLSIHHYETKQSNYYLVMKGAPETVLERCSTFVFENDDKPLDTQNKNAINRAILELGYLGERVLGFADLFLPLDLYPLDYNFDVDTPNFPLSNLRFVGLMSLIDPPRQNVPESIAICKSAGIRVVMVTGDHPITAMAIARKIGIISADSKTIYDIAIKRNISMSKVSAEEVSQCKALVVTGSDMRNMKDDELLELLINYKELVFARTSPQQKLRIVEGFQKLGAIVAVTGDGVNDSPALKRADIGISMGISGSDVSKEAANIILMDDNFSSIVTGIEEGRLVYDNLKKSIFYVLTSNLPELIPFLLYVITGLPMAINAMSVLFIDVGTDMFPAISLAYEKAERDVMSRNPRDLKTDTLINSRLMFVTYGQIGVIQTLGAYSSYFFIMGYNGFFWDRLLQLTDLWESKNINDLKDSYGREWTYQQRMKLEKQCISVYFLSIVIAQVSDLLICKTRKLSLLEQGMSNWVLNFSILFELILALMLVYIPGLNRILQFEPINLIHVLPCIPFAVLIVFYDELRKYCIRKYPNGWVFKETYY